MFAFSFACLQNSCEQIFSFVEDTGWQQCMPLYYVTVRVSHRCHWIKLIFVLFESLAYHLKSENTETFHLKTDNVHVESTFQFGEN